MRFKILLTGLFFISMISCQQELDPTIENINSIFETKDFSIEFYYQDESHRLSFRDDFVTFVAPQETKRKVISYDEAALVNSFIQKQFNNQHSPDQPELINNKEVTYQQLIIYNDTQKVTLTVPEDPIAIAQLLNALKINYVPIKKK